MCVSHKSSQQSWASLLPPSILYPPPPRFLILGGTLWGGSIEGGSRVPHEARCLTTTASRISQARGNWATLPEWLPERVP